MIHFIEDTTMEEFRNLLSISDVYRMDAADIHESMEQFAQIFAQVTRLADTIRGNVETVTNTVEYHTNSIINVSESSAELSENVGDIEQKADMNRQIAHQLEQVAVFHKQGSDIWL